MNSLKINFDKEELEIDGIKITNPFIVKVPQKSLIVRMDGKREKNFPVFQ